MCTLLYSTILVFVLPDRPTRHTLMYPTSNTQIVTLSAFSRVLAAVGRGMVLTNPPGRVQVGSVYVCRRAALLVPRVARLRKTLWFLLREGIITFTCYQLGPVGSLDLHAILTWADMSVTWDKATPCTIWLWDIANWPSFRRNL